MMRDFHADAAGERARATMINELGRFYRRRDIADVAVMQGWPIEQFRKELLREVAPEHRPHCAVGLTESEVAQYSLLRMISHMGTNPTPKTQTLELEASRAVAKQIGRDPSPGAFFVPLEIQQRDLTTTSAGSLVGSSHGNSFIEALRTRMVIRRMGAQTLSGLRDNLPLPRQTNTGTAYWLTTEGSAPTDSNQSFGEIAMTPKTIAAHTKISGQLAAQSSPSAEALVQTDLAAVVARGMDTAAINGSGASGQPMGLLLTPSIGTVTGTSLDYADLIEFQSDILASNAMINPGTLGYVSTTAIAKLLAGRQRFTGSDAVLWEGNLADGTMAGLPAMSTEQLPAGHLIFGDWSQFIVGEWGVLELATDPFTNFQTRKIGIRCFYTVDIGIRHAESFSVATAVT